MVPGPHAGNPKEAGNTQCLVVIHQKFSTYWINTGAAPSKTLDNSCVNRFLNFVTTHHLQLLVSRVWSPAAAPRLDIHHHYDCVLSADQQSLERCGQKASILCDWGSSGGPTETCSLSRQLGCLSWFIVNKGLRSANAHIDLHGTEKSFFWTGRRSRCPHIRGGLTGALFGRKTEVRFRISGKTMCLNLTTI